MRLYPAAALLFVISVTADARTDLDEFNEHVVARFHASAWLGEAAVFSQDDGYGPQYQCKLSTAGASLIQIRPHESGHMLAQWDFLPDERASLTKFEMRQLVVGGKKYALTHLPWRLAEIPPDGIILSFELPLLAFRASAESEWLPIEYLTDELFDARQFTLTFWYDDDEGARHIRKRTFDLAGFKAVAKWCGQQLLTDRANQSRVREMVR